MSYRPYPNVDRARHQLDRHEIEVRPRHLRGYDSVTAAVAVERWAAAIKAAMPTAAQLTTAWTVALKPRPVGSEEKTP